MRIQDIASVPCRMLVHPVANLSAQREEIFAALDFLFTGF
ncbi:MAG: CcdB family protein [Rugosibacter sp.]|nr:CcdB family protein [Rugosibacter sp.]